MYCEQCGTKKEQGAEFCQNCGRKLDTSSEPLLVDAYEDSATTLISQTREFLYIQDWQRKKFFAISGLPYYDVMVDKDYFYIIKMPAYNMSSWGLIIGLIVLNIIGAIIGSSMGASSDDKKRKWYRSAWIDENKNLISHEYDHDLFMKVPLIHLRGNIILKPNQFELAQGEKKIFLKKNKISMEELTKYINSYVL